MRRTSPFQPIAVAISLLVAFGLFSACEPDRAPLSPDMEIADEEAGLAEASPNVAGPPDHVETGPPSDEGVQIAVHPEELCLMEGESAQLHVVNPAGRTLPNRAVTWSSDLPDEVPVDDDGVVTGNHFTVGAPFGPSATITATWPDGAQATAEVFVARPQGYGYDYGC